MCRSACIILQRRTVIHFLTLLVVVCQEIDELTVDRLKESSAKTADILKDLVIFFKLQGIHTSIRKLQDSPLSTMP
jgi:hypothetical protein